MRPEQRAALIAIDSAVAAELVPELLPTLKE